MASARRDHSERDRGSTAQPLPPWDNGSAAQPLPTLADLGLVEMVERGERDSGKGNRNPDLKSLAATPKLADLGISEMDGRGERKRSAAISDLVAARYQIPL